MNYIYHVNIGKCEPGQLERKGHFGMAVYLLFAVDSYLVIVGWEGGEREMGGCKLGLDRYHSNDVLVFLTSTDGVIPEMLDWVGF